MKKLVTSDLKKNCNGSLELHDCKVQEGPIGRIPKHSSPYNLTISNGVDQYVLTGKTEQDVKDWVKVLRQASQRGETKTAEFRKTLSQQSLFQTEKRGYLTKKGKKRFFILKDSHLTWFPSEKVSKLKMAGK